MARMRQPTNHVIPKKRIANFLFGLTMPTKGTWDGFWSWEVLWEWPGRSHWPPRPH